MANIQSQIKRNRQNEKRRQVNQARRTRIKTRLRTFRRAVESEDVEAAEEAFREAMSALDRAAGKGVIHANKAARHKSRMTRDLEALRTG